MTRALTLLVALLVAPFAYGVAYFLMFAGVLIEGDAAPVPYYHFGGSASKAIFAPANFIDREIVRREMWERRQSG